MAALLVKAVEHRQSTGYAGRAERCPENIQPLTTLPTAALTHQTRGAGHVFARMYLAVIVVVATLPRPALSAKTFLSLVIGTYRR